MGRDVRHLEVRGRWWVMAVSNGSAELRAIAAKCREVGDGGLMNRTRATIRAQGAPLKSALRQSALDRLPKSGGLNEQVAGQRVTISSLAGPRVAGVRLSTTAPDTAQTNDGFVRHPTFGRRGKGEWRTQAIPAARGWWDDPCEQIGPPVAAAMLATLGRIAAEIESV